MGIASGLALGVGALGQGISAIVGNAANSSAQERAALLQDKGVQEWLKINIPDPAQQKLALQRFVQVGELTPELETAVKAHDSELAKVTVDPRYKESRLRALGSLEQTGYGGEQLADQAAQQNELIQSGARNRGAQEAVLGSMERRGQLGTGLELQGRLDASQAEGDRLASNSLDLETARRQRALQAIQGAGSLAGDMQSDEYGMKSDAAKARDTINMFNTTNAQGVQGRNVDRSNNAQEYNLNLKQGVSDKNTGLSNFEQQYNKELNQQRFDNEAKKAAGVSGQYGQQAATAIDNGKSAAAMWGGIASGIGQTAGSAAGLAEDAERRKAGLDKKEKK